MSLLPHLYTNDGNNVFTYTPDGSTYDCSQETIMYGTWINASLYHDTSVTSEDDCSPDTGIWTKNQWSERLAFWDMGTQLSGAPMFSDEECNEHVPSKFLASGVQEACSRRMSLH